MEYLDESHRELFSAYTSDFCAKCGCEDGLLRIFAYFVYRHASVAESERDFKCRVHLTIILERLAASLIAVHGLGAAEALRIISAEIEYSTENTDALLLEIEFMEA